MKYFFGLLLAVVVGLVSGVWLTNEWDASLAPVLDAPAEAPISAAGETSGGGMLEAVISGGVTVYDGVEVGAGTRELSLTNRGLTGSLKAEVRLLTELEVLDLSGNAFTGLPAEVGQLRNLRVLNLANNQFTGLPLELGNLQNLEVLDVRGNPNIAEVDLVQIIDRLPATVEVLR